MWICQLLIHTVSPHIGKSKVLLAFPYGFPDATSQSSIRVSALNLVAITDGTRNEPPPQQAVLLPGQNAQNTRAALVKQTATHQAHTKLYAQSRAHHLTSAVSNVVTDHCGADSHPLGPLRTTDCAGGSAGRDRYTRSWYRPPGGATEPTVTCGCLGVKQRYIHGRRRSTAAGGAMAV